MQRKLQLEENNIFVIQYGGTQTQTYRVADSTEGTTGKGTREKYAITHELADVIKRWYYILRLIAIVGMMSALVYIGIRILLSSTSSQKAKYKQLLGDWFVGMVLLFTMHFIMNFSNIAVDHLTELFKTINPMGQTALIPDDNDKVEKELKEYEIEVVNTETKVSKDNKIVYKDKDQKYIEWNTDLMGQLRIALQAHRDGSEEYIGYTIMYVTMVIFTAIFCFVYIRRVIYMAFLTIIAPLVALTYPIDKANDGNAQGFNYWFKEYIFNLLLQPLHLLLYTILVSSAVKFATENIIYSIVALGFIVSAEKILRQMFNFTKASTPGIFAGPAGAALTMTGMRWLFGHGPRGEKGAAKGSDKGEANSEDAGITSSGQTKFDINDSMSGLLGSGRADNQNSANEVTTNNEQTNDRSLLENMGEAAEEESLVPSEEQNMMWDNDRRDEDESEGMDYDDETYAQILRDNGYSEEDIAKMIGEDEPETKPKIRGVSTALGDAFDAYKDGMRKKLYRNLENAQPVKALGRMAAGAVGAATFGTLGVAAGVASGDVRSVGQYGAAGIAGGAKLGTGLLDSADRATHVDGVTDVLERSYYGNDEYNKRIAERNQKQVAEDEKNIRLVQDKLGKSRIEAKEWLSENVPYMMERKVNDVSDMININKLQEKGPKVTDKYGVNRPYTKDEAIGAYKIYNRYDISKKTGKGKEKDVIDQISKDYTKGNNENAIRLFNAAKDYDNILNG